MTLHARLACASALLAFGLAAAPASATTINFNGTGAPDNSVIETALPGFGDEGPVDVNFRPLPAEGNDIFSTMNLWNDVYSGQSAAICSGGFGVPCVIDLSVASGFSVTLESISFGTIVSTLVAASQNIAWNVLDLGTSAVLGSGTVQVFQQAPADVAVGVTSTAGLRLNFWPELRSNGGLTGFSYSYAPVTTTPPTDPSDPSVVPLPAAGWLLLAGLGGLAALRRRA